MKNENCVVCDYTTERLLAKTETIGLLLLACRLCSCGHILKKNAALWDWCAKHGGEILDNNAKEFNSLKRRVIALLKGAL